jgi:flagellar hook-associated protein 2
MSTSPTSGTGAVSTNAQYGTNIPPISFPGIASGIDYTSIINKLISLQTIPEIALNAQVATLNAANAELIKINDLIQSVQTSLANLSNPNLFSSYNALSSNLNVATAQGLPSAVATPGTYIIDSVQVATSTTVTSSVSAGYQETATIASGTYAGQNASNVPLADSYAAVTPSNGGGAQGSITIDGVTVQYNVNVDSINAIFARINAAVQAVDPSFSIGYAPGTDTVQITGSKPITLGSASDQGNLLQVLKLSTAQVNNSGPGPYTVAATSGVGGINDAAPLNGTTNANFVTPVTSGFFTINGVQIQVSASGDNVASILQKINSSSAGVNAFYNAATNQIQLVSTTTGAQSIVLGAPGDTSNFLSAAGLTTASGATTVVGQQAQVQVQQPSGSVTTFYSNSNQVTNAIPGIQLNLVSNDSGATATPFSVTVSQNTSVLVSAMTSFVSAYNAAVGEINAATAPPAVTSSTPGSSSSTSTSFGGGVLFNNPDVSYLQEQLTQMVSGFFGNQTLFNGAGYSGTQNQYNSLASIGLSLSSTFSQITTGSNNSVQGQNAGSSDSADAGSPAQMTSYQGTDGTFQPLNVQTFLNALQADPSAVQQLLQGAQGLTNSLGSFLTGVTGFPTILDSGPVGTVPSVSTMQNAENTNSSEITSIQQQIKQITDNANMQANLLRQEFVSSETLISEYQALQAQVNAMFKSGG